MVDFEAVRWVLEAASVDFETLTYVDRANEILKALESDRRRAPCRKRHRSEPACVGRRSERYLRAQARGMAIAITIAGTRTRIVGRVRGIRRSVAAPLCAGMAASRAA